jgi:hypothetical protein
LKIEGDILKIPKNILDLEAKENYLECVDMYSNSNLIAPVKVVKTNQALFLNVHPAATEEVVDALKTIEGILVQK